jgi:three-Cys-motif partner protein
LTEHAFGGNWTQTKLGRLEKYLRAYRTIFTQNEKARYFKTWYVDAFAGTGSRSTSDTPLFEEVYEDDETKGYLDGSAKIAIGLAEPFDHYLFIDKSKKHLDELKAAIARDHPKLVDRCIFERGDSNDVLKRWCAQRNWTKERAVVFLDPYGMQVEWNTIEGLAKTKAVDLWYLFPLGIGVSRLLTRDGQIPDSWQKRLDAIFGTTDWRTRFYEVQRTPTLFGDKDSVGRSASEEKIQEFVTERLKSCFAGVARGLILRNSRSNPLYLLCFAAANKVGARTAIKIAQHILDE